MTNIIIQSIPFGLKEAVMVEPVYGEKSALADGVKMKLLFKDSQTNVLFEDLINYTSEEYLSFGENKAERIDAILVSKGVVKVVSELP